MSEPVVYNHVTLDLVSPTGEELCNEYAKFSTALRNCFQLLPGEKVVRQVLYVLFWAVTKRLLEISSSLAGQFYETISKEFSNIPECSRAIATMKSLSQEKVTQFCWNLPSVTVSKEEHLAVITAIKDSKAVHVAALMRENLKLEVVSAKVMLPQAPSPVTTSPTSSTSGTPLQQLDLLLKRQHSHVQSQSSKRHLTSIHLGGYSPVTCACLSSSPMTLSPSTASQSAESQHSSTSTSPQLLASCPDQLMAAGYEDGRVSIYQLTVRINNSTSGSEETPADSISPDQISHPNSAVLFCVRLPYPSHKPSRPVTAVEFTVENNLLLTANVDGKARLWDLYRRQALMEYSNHSLPIWSLATCPTYASVFATGSQDNTVSLWCTDRPAPLRQYVGSLCGVKTVAFHQNGRYISSGDGMGHIRFYDVRSANCLYVWDPKVITERAIINSFLHKQSNLSMDTADSAALLGCISVLSFSSCGQMLAAGSEFGRHCVMDLRMCSSTMSSISGSPSPLLHSQPPLNGKMSLNCNKNTFDDSTLLFRNEKSPDLHPVNSLLWKKLDIRPEKEKHRLISASGSGRVNYWDLSSTASTPKSVLHLQEIALQERLIRLDMGPEVNSPLIAILWSPSSKPTLKEAVDDHSLLS